MTKRSQFDEIYDSMINGQPREAIKQLTALGLDDAPELLDYLAIELNQPKIALDLAKSYFRFISR